MQAMCTRFRSRRTAAHPIAMKHVLRPFRVAFTGGRLKTFMLDVSYRSEPADKIGWTPGWIKDSRSQGSERVGYGDTPTTEKRRNDGMGAAFEPAGVVGARTTQAAALNVYTPKRELSKDHALNRYPPDRTLTLNRGKDGAV